MKEQLLHAVELNNKYYKKVMFDPPELSIVLCKASDIVSRI